MKVCRMCHSESLVRFSSLNKVYCNDCGAWLAWELKEGQQPIVTNNRQRKKKS